MPPPVSQYEIGIDFGSAGMSRAPSYAVRRFEYGDGFYDHVVTGDVEGTILWTINLNRIFRDAVPSGVSLGGLLYRARYYGTNGLDGAYVTTDVPTGYPRSRVNYWWCFIKRRMEYGDPFWVVDPRTKPETVARPGYLVSLIKPDFDFKQDPQDALRYNLTLQFRQARGWLAPPSYGKVA